MRIFIALVFVFVCGYFQGRSNKVAADSEEKLQRMFDESEAVIAEMRGLTADAQAAVAGVRKAEQERNSEGEARRENMSTAMRTDKCAGAVVPVAVSDGLLRKNKSANPTDSPASAAKPDK
ncbi:hypothetical protein [Escherichia coli]|uniref:hypothetical protein n=1 Tax=Escherichia coli TaxID=562 RepID=UPI0032D9E426